MEELKEIARGPIDVLIVGSGSREHALLWKFAQSEMVGEIHMAPGNGGTIGHNVGIQADDIRGLSEFARDTGCITVVGPDRPLELGIVDYFMERGLPIFGPTRNQAMIEWSKIHSKETMRELGIPTAQWTWFTDKDPRRAMQHASLRGGNVVVKADGLADGKGVYVCSSVEESNAAINAVLVEKKFGRAGERMLIEEKLVGRELSVFALCNGIDAVYLGSAVDYKRLLDGDRGPNTGGMGSYSPVGWAGDELISWIMQRMVIPTVRHTRFSGFLYLGLMITENGPMLIEYNARFGDPEAQAIMPRLNIDLLAEVDAIARGEIRAFHRYGNIFNNLGSCCVVLTSEGYARELGREQRRIHGIEEAQGDALIFHAGTTRSDGELFAEPGKRVMSIVGVGSDASDARARAYAAAEKISFEGMHYRKEIGVQRTRVKA